MEAGSQHKPSEQFSIAVSQAKFYSLPEPDQTKNTAKYIRMKMLQASRQASLKGQKGWLHDPCSNSV